MTLYGFPLIFSEFDALIIIDVEQFEWTGEDAPSFSARVEGGWMGVGRDEASRGDWTPFASVGCGPGWSSGKLIVSK